DAQQSYFNYDEDEEEERAEVVDHNISFREGTSRRGEATFCPRLLLFDRKTNFGALSRTNELYDDVTGEAGPDPSLWDGSVYEIRQDRIPQSQYQDRIDEEIDEEPYEPTSRLQRDEATGPIIQSSDVRYWSDYNRVYYLPRSVHKLPDAADFDNSGEDWQNGKEVFERYDSDAALMEESFRLFMEECDSFQGLSVATDSTTFGSFTASFLTAFRDEYTKSPSMVFPILSEAVPEHVEADDTLGIRRVLNDALLLRSLNEMSSLNIPLQNPRTWKKGRWSEDLNLNLLSSYEVSAVLSAHVETSTLPLRLKATAHMSELCHELNLHGNTPFVELSGAFPALSAESLDQRLHNFSCSEPGAAEGNAVVFYKDVARGSQDAVLHRSGNVPTTGSISSLIQAPVPYPLPSSYPSFFRAPHLNDQPRRTSRGILTKPRYAPILSSIGLSSGIPAMFESYASFLEDRVRKKFDWYLVGIDGDEAKGLTDDLWTICDNFGVSVRSENADSLGEDEEA
ncbi:tubulin domain-containing protein, partial [Amylostereum chailletii]